MAVDVLGLNDTFISQLRNAITGGVAGLEDVPMLLKCVLKDNRWRERRLKNGSTAEFAYFEDFVTAKPLEGLGCSLDLIRGICSNDPEALDLIDQALQRPHGGSREGKLYNVQLASSPAGNTKQRALRRLRGSRPDLHARVLAKELTPHAAMIEAGFRKQRFSALSDDPESIVDALKKHCTPEVIDQVRALLE